MPVSREQFEQLLDVPEETEHLEFKEAKHSFDEDKLCSYCVALANERGGSLILGVTNRPPRRVVGTSAFTPQEIVEKVFSRLRMRVQVDEVDYDGRRSLVINIPSRPTAMPLEFEGRYLMRVGESLVSMSPDQLQRILEEAQTDYSADVLVDASLQDLEGSSIEEFRERWSRKSGNPKLKQLGQIQLLEDAGLIVGGRVTVAALILFGSESAVTRLLPSAELVFEYRSSETSIAYQQRIEFRRGVFGFYNGLWETINLRNDTQSFQDGLFRVDIPTFDEAVIREAVLNAFCHRDYRIQASVFVRQSPRVLEIVSPGSFPPGVSEKNVLDRQVPRNRRLAEAFSKAGLVERSGQGMNRMFEESIKQGKALPDFSGSDSYQVAVRLRGEVQNPHFVRFLEKIGSDRLESFGTYDFLALDAIQREDELSEAMKVRIPRLLDAGVVEKVGRKFILSRDLYAQMGQKGVYTRRKGLDHETNKALLIKHLEENPDGSSLGVLSQVLPQFNERRVQRLLQELRREGKADVIGQRRWARWIKK